MKKFLANLLIFYGIIICVTIDGICSDLIKDDPLFQKSSLAFASTNISSFEHLYENSVSKDKSDILSLASKYEEDLKKMKIKKLLLSYL